MTSLRLIKGLNEALLLDQRILLEVFGKGVWRTHTLCITEYYTLYRRS